MFSKRHYQAIAQTIQDIEVSAISGQQREHIAANFANMLEQDNPLFKRGLFLQACRAGQNVRARTVKPYQPKTGASCSCRSGIERDNCPRCEGTGMVIDFQAIRARA